MKARAKRAKTTNKWSARVLETSNAMDIAGGTFSQRSAAKIARDLFADADRSTRKKSSSYRSAMSMLTFYINRAGRNLSATRRATLERAKRILRREYGPQAGA